MKRIKYNNYIGQQFNKLKIIKIVYNQEEKRNSIVCLCDCGEEHIVGCLSLLVDGITKSCGCYNIEKTIERNTIHGKSDTRIYRVWQGMKARCYDENSEKYYCYGKRGIKVSNNWLNFENFYSDMGNPPFEGATIHRIHNDKDYCKENCVWATQKIQANNKSTNRVIVFNNKSQTLQQWSEELNINRATLSSRVDRLGWSIEKAFSVPSRKKKSSCKKF